MVAVLTLVAGAALASLFLFDRDPTGFRPQRPAEAAPLCPWRNPDDDMAIFFPGASNRRVETRILSGQRLELMKMLGRPPEPDELSLQLHRIRAGGAPAGTVMVRRARGEHGSIEVVLAVNTNREIVGLRLQRLREPEALARQLQDERWLKSFYGKTATNGFLPEQDIPLPSAETNNSALALTDAVKSMLVLLEVSEAAAQKAHH